MFKKSLVVLSAALVLAGTSVAFAMAGNSDHRAGKHADSSARQWRQASPPSDVKTRRFPGDNSMDPYIRDRQGP